MNVARCRPSRSLLVAALLLAGISMLAFATAAHGSGSETRTSSASMTPSWPIHYVAPGAGDNPSATKGAEIWQEASEGSIARPAGYEDHVCFYRDTVGEASHLDIDALMITLDDEAGLVVFDTKFAFPYSGFSHQDYLIFLIATDQDANTGLGGWDYAVRADYDGQYGSYYMQVVNLANNAAQLVYGAIPAGSDTVQIWVPDYLLPNHHYFAFYAMSGNKVGGAFDYLPDYGSNPLYLLYSDPATTTTLPPTTTTTLPSTTTTTAPHTQQFSDVSGNHPYAVQISDLAARGIIGGFTDGTFKPDSSVTRQQFAKMIVKTLDLPVSEADDCPFTDVMTNMPSSDPLYPDHYIAVCAAQGITVGKTPTSFAPYSDITRAQLITMVARSVNLPEPPGSYAPPFGAFDTTHYPFARKAAYAGLLDGLQGVGPGFAFFDPATRGEVCALLFNLLRR